VSGTATAGSDFTASTGAVTFAVGQTTATISIPVLANTTPLTAVNREDAETFTVELFDATGGIIGSQGVGTVPITADAVVGVSSFSIDSVSAVEGGVALLTVTRSGDLVGQVSVNFATVAGTALAGTDFISSSGQLTFLAGETTKTI